MAAVVKQKMPIVTRIFLIEIRGLNRLRNTQFLINDEESPVNVVFDRALRDEIGIFKLLNHPFSKHSISVLLYLNKAFRIGDAFLFEISLWLS